MLFASYFTCQIDTRHVSPVLCMCFFLLCCRAIQFRSVFFSPCCHTPIADVPRNELRAMAGDWVSLVSDYIKLDVQRKCLTNRTYEWRHEIIDRKHLLRRTVSMEIFFSPAKTEITSRKRWRSLSDPLLKYETRSRFAFGVTCMQLNQFRLAKTPLSSIRLDIVDGANVRNIQLKKFCAPSKRDPIRAHSLRHLRNLWPPIDETQTNN